MNNQRILLGKVKTINAMMGINSVWKAMKFISVLCMVTVLFIGCGEPNLDDPKVREKVTTEAIEADTLQSRRSPSGAYLSYAPNQAKPYVGWVKNGRELVQFHNGKPNGLYISWYSNGQNWEKGTFRNGVKEGLWIKWHQNGQKSGTGSYKDDNQDGTWVFWYGNGQKQSEGSYKAGQKDGLWTEWSKNGQTHDKGLYKRSQKDGLWTALYENGQKHSEGTYTNGKKENVWTEWHQNGQKRSEGTYTNDKKENVWTEWHQNGQKQSKGIYLKNSKDGMWFTWYQDGNIHRVSPEGKEYEDFKLTLSPDWQTIAGVNLTSVYWASPDKLAQYTVYTAIYIWNVKTGKLLKQLKGHEIPIRKVVFSPDSKRLLSFSFIRVNSEKNKESYFINGSYRLWDVETGKNLSRIPANARGNHVFSYDGKILARGVGFQNIEILNVNTGKLLKTLKLLKTFTMNDPSRLTFSPDGKILAYYKHHEEGSRLGLLKVNTGSQLLRRLEKDIYFYCQAFSPDGKTIALGSSGGKIYLRNGITGSPQKSLAIQAFHERPDIEDVVFSPDGRILACINDNKTVDLWNLTTGELQKTFSLSLTKDHSFGFEIVFSPDGKTLAVSEKTLSGPSILSWNITHSSSRVN